MEPPDEAWLDPLEEAGPEVDPPLVAERWPVLEPLPPLADERSLELATDLAPSL